MASDPVKRMVCPMCTRQAEVGPPVAVFPGEHCPLCNDTKLWPPPDTDDTSKEAIDRALAELEASGRATRTPSPDGNSDKDTFKFVHRLATGEGKSWHLGEPDE